MTEVDKEAMRIWLLPETQWRQELLALPVEKELHNVRWRYRLAVGHRLKMAENLERMGSGYHGWPRRSEITQEETNETV